MILKQPLHKLTCGAKYYLIYAIWIFIELGFGEHHLTTAQIANLLNFLSLVYVYVVETKGRSFLEIDHMFVAKTPARKFRGTHLDLDEIRKTDKDNAFERVAAAEDAPTLPRT